MFIWFSSRGSVLYGSHFNHSHHVSLCKETSHFVDQLLFTFYFVISPLVLGDVYFLSSKILIYFSLFYLGLIFLRLHQLFSAYSIPNMAVSPHALPPSSPNLVLFPSSPPLPYPSPSGNVYSVFPSW